MTERKHRSRVGEEQGAEPPEITKLRREFVRELNDKLDELSLKAAYYSTVSTPNSARRLEEIGRRRCVGTLLRNEYLFPIPLPTQGDGANSEPCDGNERTVNRLARVWKMYMKLDDMKDEQAQMRAANTQESARRLMELEPKIQELENRLAQEADYDNEADPDCSQVDELTSEISESDQEISDPFARDEEHFNSASQHQRECTQAEDEEPVVKGEPSVTADQMESKRDRARLAREEAEEPVEEMKQRIGRTRQLHDELAAKSLQATFQCDRADENSHRKKQRVFSATSSKPGETSAPDEHREAESGSARQGPISWDVAGNDTVDPFDERPHGKSPSPEPESDTDTGKADNPGHQRRRSVTAQITKLQTEAARLRRVIAANPQRSPTEQYRLPEVERKIAELSERKEVEVRAGVVVRPTSEQLPGLSYHLTETLRDPSHVAADASETRAELIAEAGILELALDVAETVGACNSMERMLCDQFALSHSMAMRFGKRAMDEETETDTAMKMVRASTTAMAGSRATYETMMRMRRGGQQVITVQSVSVQDGANAVIAGNIGRRKRCRGDAKRSSKTSALNATTSEKGGQQ